MSVDTRTPRTSPDAAPRGFVADESVLGMVKVPSDPAQVIVNHASFRVQLASPPAPSPAVAAFAGASVGASVGALSGAPVGAGGGAATATAVRPPRVRRPLVWSGRSAPGDPGAGTLLQAVRVSEATRAAERAGAARETTLVPVAAPSAGGTRVLRRVPAGGGSGLPETAHPTGRAPVVAPRAPQEAETTRLPRVPAPARRSPAGADAAAASAGADRPGHTTDDVTIAPDGGPAGAHGRDGRQAFHPDRRMSLGVVLLPLRVLLGFIAIYAGMGKLTNPVYFDGAHGSMVGWLSGLEPWAVAQPLHNWAVAHPVAAGLTVAFTQIVVGVLTLCGLWQRLAAALGALLSLALLVTVSWQSGPAYDTPDIILLAAWSPLIIAGAPVYSLDARLAGEAWRTLGPRAPLNELRRRVLRRGTVLATVLLGLALLVGSTLGSAVRSAQIATVPEPGEPPRNHLPGQPLPDDSLSGRSGSGDGPSDAPEGGAEESAEGEPAEEGGAPPAGEEAPPDAGEGTPDATPEEQPSAPEGAAPEQPAPDSSGSAEPAPEPGQPEPGAGDGGGAGSSEQPPEEDAEEPAEEGGDSGSLGPIGGLLN